MITADARIDPRLVVETLPVSANSKTMKVDTINWFPVPTAAQKRVDLCGNLKTSPWMSFQPDSSSSTISSSTSMYLLKSFFKTLMKMIVTNAVSKRTSTHELIIESQCIS
eukprot:267947_1